MDDRRVTWKPCENPHSLNFSDSPAINRAMKRAYGTQRQVGMFKPQPHDGSGWIFHPVHGTVFKQVYGRDT